MILIGVALELALVGVAWGLGLWFGVSAWETLQWSWRGLGLGVLATLPMVPVFLVCERWPFGPLRRIRQFIDEVVRPLLGGASTFELALLALAAGLGEELLFRGVIQAVLDDRLGTWQALILASLIFGLLHAITPGYVVLAAGIGAYLGWTWIASGNLLVPIVAHALYDFLALVYLLQGPGRATIERETDSEVGFGFPTEDPTT
ncbi:hypothetical protein BH23PLA1_BH23PLA1_42240 [soil metagenome]